MDNQNYNHEMNFMPSAQPTTPNIDSMDKNLAAEATMNDHAHSLTATSPSFSDMSISKTNLGKEKRTPRMRFSQEACDRLYSLYKAGISKPNKQLREELAKELGTTPRSIQIWFQNRRAKAKHIFAQYGQEISDEEEFPGLYNRKQLNLSLNMNSLPSSHSSSPKSAHTPYYSSPYSSSYVNHLQSRPSPGQRRISADNITSSPYSSVQRRHSSQFLPQQMRSTSLGGIYQRSPQGSFQSPVSHLLGYDSPSFGDLMKNDYSLTKEQSAYPSPQEMQYGRPSKSFSSNGSGKIDSSQSGSFPPSATELIRSSPTSVINGSRFCQEPLNDTPYHTGFNFENMSSNENEPFHESGASKSKFAATLPDLQEITSDPSKFINWLNNSN
jgi:hypothetical protein